jgi:hypothetical protein
MRDEHPVPKPPETPRPGIPKDESRLLMMRRHKDMTLEERLDLFEQLSRFITWAHSATRLR